MDAEWDLMKPFVPMVGKEGHLSVAAVLMLTGLSLVLSSRKDEARSWLMFFFFFCTGFFLTGLFSISMGLLSTELELRQLTISR